MRLAQMNVNTFYEWNYADIKFKTDKYSIGQ
jgi:hypothetical protein